MAAAHHAIKVKNEARKRKQEAVAAQMFEDAEAAGRIFDEIDGEKTGNLSREQTRALLQRVTGVEEVREDGLVYIFNEVHAKIDASSGAEPAPEPSAGVAYGGDVAGVSSPSPESDVLPRALVLDAVAKFRYYLPRMQRVRRAANPRPPNRRRTDFHRMRRSTPAPRYAQK